MNRVVYLLALMAALIFGQRAAAQDRTWIQVEARPSLVEGQDRARAWSTAFGDVSGYRLNSGWFGVVLGPYGQGEAASRLAELKRQGLIPADSYLTDSRPFRDSFWPATDALPAAEAQPAPAEGAPPPATPEVTALAPLTETAPPEPAQSAPAESEPAQPATTTTTTTEDETPEASRQAEARLSPEERMEIQTALKWFGFYDAAVDGAIGRGTRASISAWQEARGFAATGVLSGAQRRELVGGWQADQRDFGFQTVTEAEAGIEIALPLSMVAFDHYEPPFVHFAERDGSGVRIVLISTTGDAATLAGLYDQLQTLAIVPAKGPRRLEETGFTIEGRSDDTQTYVQAELARGMVKGFVLSGPTARADQLARVLPIMKASFRFVGDRALDPGLVPMGTTTRDGLMAGLEVKKPRLSRSGLFVDGKGTVLTTAEAVAQCARITLEREVPARVALVDAAAGIAVLTPERPLAPAAFARFQTRADRQGGEISVSGYPYEGRLPAPTLTFGALAEAQGLGGEPGLKRLSVPVLAGDAGGPVLDPTGAVIGMLLARDADAGRRLPEGVVFAAAPEALSAVLARAGITATAEARSTTATPAALVDEAAGMTALVSCWE